MPRLLTFASRPLARLQRRFERSRPGSVLIFVIALLVLLALMGTAYISTARLDRYAAQGGNSGQDVNRDAAEALQAAINEAIAMAQGDPSPVTSQWPPKNPSATAADPTVAKSSVFLAARAPELLTDPNPKHTGRVQPGWSYVTRRANQIYDSINSTSGMARYDFDGANSAYSDKSDVPWQMIPTNLVVNYTAGASPDLVGKTKVFPAFLRWRTVNGQPRQEGPFIAGDATGSGVADSVGYKLVSTKTGTYYVFLRIVDNAAAINISTAWDRNKDLDANGSAYNAFPTDIDLAGLLYNGVASSALNELKGIDFVRVKNGFTKADKPEIPTGTTTRGDFTWLTEAEGFWMQYGRRLNYPHTSWGDQSNKQVRPYDPSTNYGVDTAAIAYHAVMASNPPTPASNFEQKDLKYLDTSTGFTNTTVANSFDRSAMNFVTSAVDQFNFVPANFVGLWYDWNYNFDATKSGVGAHVVYPLAATGTGLGANAEGGQFRSLKGITVASNPLLNYPRMRVMGALPAGVIGTGAINLQTMPTWDKAPHKTSLNTAQFGELWRAYWNVIAEAPATGSSEVFHVPGVDTLTNPTWGKLSAYNQFSSTLRDTKVANSDSASGRGRVFTNGAKGNVPQYAFDCYNMALLRAAIAAANTMHYRDSTGMVTNSSGKKDKMGDYTVSDKLTGPAYPGKPITLQATQISGTSQSQVPVQVYVYGNEAQPFITEVYANSNTQKNNSTKYPTDNDKQNTSGYVAVELYNPYDEEIELANYAFGVVQRDSGAPYLGTGLTVYGHPADPLDTTQTKIIRCVAIAGQNTKILPHKYKILDNYNKTPNVALGDAAYRPGLVTATAGAGDFLHVQHLTRVFDNGTDKGGELVILRPTKLTVGTNANPRNPLYTYVPVDSYDFTGLVMTALKPTGAATLTQADLNSARSWHYCRQSGATGTAAWQCVFPGHYDASQTQRQVGTKYVVWDPTKDPETWEQTPPSPLLQFDTDKSKASDPANFASGIRLNNSVFSRNTKYGGSGGTATFPYGGFMRVGDATEVPFIGAYQVYLQGNTTKPLEINAISMDAAFADDGDTTNDAKEQVGHFCPLTDDQPFGHNDYAPYGQYPGDAKYVDAVPNGPPAARRATYTYQFATRLMDNFTVVSNPQDDLTPNIDVAAWTGTAPAAVPNYNGTTNGTEDFKPVEGLVNLNTAPWQVLSRIEWLPAAAFAKTADARAANLKVAQWIVSYRDYDDGTHAADPTNVKDPVPHGPFASLMELNEVFEPATPANKFRYAFNNSATLKIAAGKTFPIPGKANQTPSEIWGNYAVQGIASTLPADFANETLMVNRVSNLLALRSDSFTAYVMVQGWRNVGKAEPELVVQRRAAMLLDRTGSPLPGTNVTVSSYPIPSK